ncbi:hypothetical protein QBC43DRAFT_352252 [Cladorrhinum sp. PSN259]|nr:hypothetical protein QBC43DRAFT_352252 [Cladorrhinum sp. PSN259]
MSRIQQAYRDLSDSEDFESLTIGVEFEFFAAYRQAATLKSKCDDGDYYLLPDNQGDAFEHIANEIERATFYRDKVHNQRPGNHRAVPPNTFAYYEKYWTVKQHEGFMASSSSSHRWHDVEIASPIMNPQDVPARLQPVLDRLKSNFHLGVSEHCALQVHVGCGSSGFTQETIKKLATVLWLAQGRLDELYAPHRRRDPWAAGFEEYAIAKDPKYDRILPQNDSFLYVYWLQDVIDNALEQGEISRDKAKRIQLMWEEDSLSKLCGKEILQPIPSARGSYTEYSGAYSFYNLVQSREGSFYSFSSSSDDDDDDDYGDDSENATIKRTVEFRRPEGTVDADVAAAWCHVFAGLVEFARGSSQGNFQRVVGNLLLLPVDSYSLVAFLEQVGCEGGYIEVLLNKDDPGRLRGRDG